MKSEQVKAIANAILYEGYLLYPYRRSAIKNRTRWTFGVVYPREYSEAQGGVEPWTMRTECLVTGNAETTLDVTVRFLHLLVRGANLPGIQVQAEAVDASGWGAPGRQAADSWQEGIEREISALNLTLSDLLVRPWQVAIKISGERIVDPPTTATAAEMLREQQPLRGVVVIAAEPVTAAAPLFKLSVQIENTTPETGGARRHDAIVLQSFVSTHTLLQVRQGAFLSLLDPPEALKGIAQECHNQHTWPVLVGAEGECDALLSSPIILYDYPQIAPESAGALFDGTEIDEILTLRILTLTDEEKEELRQGDERAREVLERTEALSSEQLMKLHGVIRSLRPLDTGGKA